MKTGLFLGILLSVLIIFSTLSTAEASGTTITVMASKVHLEQVYLEKGDTIVYGLIVGGGKNNDIDFKITDPSGRNLVTTTVYSKLNSDFIADRSGNYQFVFDNKMSYISKKTIQFSWDITKPVLAISHSQSSGNVIFGTEWIYLIVIAIIVIGIAAGVKAKSKKKRKGTDYSGLLDEGKNNKPSADKKEKKSSNKRCWHNDSWVRDDRMEICSSCGKELGKRLGKGNESESKEEAKSIEAQQNLDSYVAQNVLENNSLEKETINDIERNEEALGILKERLAKGEISVKDFQEIKKELS